MNQPSPHKTPKAATLPQLQKHVRLLRAEGYSTVEIRYDANRCPYIVGMMPDDSNNAVGDMIDAA